MTIKWTHATRQVSDLKPNPNNPRTITKDAYKTLVKNLKRNGYANRLIINTDGMVLCGNQRLIALTELGYTEIDVLVPSETLNDDQINDITITDNLSAGSWDFDCLGNLFDLEKLIEWGMPAGWFGFDNQKEKKDSEIAENDFSELDHKCPKCGFEYD